MPAPLQWPTKDPDERVDFGVDWSARLVGDTIVSSLWIVPDGIVGSEESHADRMTTIWLEGGTPRLTYELLNRVETSAGRIMDQTIRLPVAKR
ncbi:hypothetical protein [Antarcticirhabdus aurantiaca]|uniref:Uncharacterized protein n=1 Tax=Antarcticirhabdus aurantiaca TaxID=2606717 RepID=A0ACD4NRC6_9HYPH|nr:hypothetical protein OXU80_03645 [Jeongeuplla avenae]